MKLSIIMVMILTGVIGCNASKDSPVSSSAVHPVSISLDGYTTAGLKDLFIPSAYAAVSDLSVCFKRLRFKKDISDTTTAETSDDNIDLALGQVSLSAAGTGLGTVNVPEGTYYRIEFDLEPECAGQSATLSNDFGSFSSNSRITIKFEGTFIVNGSESLVLGVQDILNAANAHDGSINLKDSLESASGTL